MEQFLFAVPKRLSQLWQIYNHIIVNSQKLELQASISFSHRHDSLVVKK